MSKATWSLKRSPEGEGGNNPTVFRDLYCNGELVAERIYSDQAERLTDFLNLHGVEGLKHARK